MKKNSATVDTSVLIALDTVGQLGLLSHLYSSVFAPPAVVREFRSSLPSFVKQQSLNQASSQLAKQLCQSLGPGESEAIALGMELSVDEVIIDDARARKEAQNRGLTVVGVVGLLLRAKQSGLIDQVKPLLDALRALGFRIGEDLYLHALALANE